MLVQSVSIIEKITERLKTEAAVVIPVFIDQQIHPAINTVSSLHILIGDDYYCIPTKHPDAFPMHITLDTAREIITLYKREILHLSNVLPDNVFDVASIIHLSGKDLPSITNFYSPSIVRTLNNFQFKNLHLSIPITLWMEYGKKITKFVRDNYYTEFPDGYSFTNNVVIPTLTTIEKSGLAVDNTILKTQPKYIKDNLVYSEYNPYTSTGRPSNKYGGINYAALNKHDGIRKSFVSRYGEDGLLVQFDYEAFHLRLIAEKINYKLPETSVHTYLAQQYYKKTDITEEEYENSKVKTFTLLYGNHDDSTSIDFFLKVKEYSENLWSFYNKHGYIKTNTGKKLRVTEPTQNKVFNYSVQWCETEVALQNIKDVCELLDNKLTKPVLYTYDALLLDLHRSETALLPRIKYLLEQNGYPVRMYKGKNYDELIRVEI